MYVLIPIQHYIAFISDIAFYRLRSSMNGIKSDQRNHLSNEINDYTNSASGEKPRRMLRWLSKASAKSTVVIINMIRNGLSQKAKTVQLTFSVKSGGQETSVTCVATLNNHTSQ
jgi:hypothetical protein